MILFKKNGFSRVKSFTYFVLSVLLLIALLSNQLAYSQQLIISNKTYSYPFIITQNSSLNPHVSNIINRLKRTDVKQDFSISFTIDLTIKITKESQNKYIAIAELTKKECPGGAFYRNFDICSEFFPSTIQFNYQFTYHNKTSQIPFEAKLMLQKNIEQIHAWTDTASVSNFDINPTLISLNYNQTWENEMIQKINLIDLFYQSDSLINSWDSTLNSMNFEKIEMLPIFDFELDEIEKSIEYFINSNILSILNPNEEKHQSLKNKITEINIKAGQKRLLLTEYLHWIDYRFIEKARTDLKIINPVGAIYNYSKALEYHPLSIPALLELGRLMLEQNNLNEASNLLKTIFSLTWPQGKTLEDCRKFGIDLYAAIVLKGNLLLKDEEFHRAIQAYSIADIFCDSIRENICNNKHYEGIVKSKYGILRSYFNVINKALQRDLLSIAENYAYEAKKYQIANQKEISDDKEIQIIVDQIITRYVSSAMQNIDKGKFETAIIQLHSADSLGHTFRENFSLKYLDESRRKAFNGAFLTALNESQSLLAIGNIKAADLKHSNAMTFYHQHPDWITDTTSAYLMFLKIRQEEVKQKVIIGNNLYIQAEFSNSLNVLQEAKSIENYYKFKPDTLLDSLLLSISKPIAFERLNSVSMKIWRNELIEAKEIIDYVDSLILKSNLQNDYELMELFQSTKRKFESQECDFTNAQISQLEYDYKRSISSQNFTNALLAIDSIRFFQTHHSRCVLNPKNYDSEYRFVIPASNYEKLIQNADIEFRLKHISQALAYYFEADSLYKVQKLNEFGVFQIVLSTFFYKSPDFNLIIETCNQLIESPHFEMALPLLSILERNAFIASKTKQQQKKLADILRNQDLIKYPDMKCNELIKRYPVKGKWFYVFRKTYLKNPITAFFE